MSETNQKRIGILVGQEKEWPKAFITAVNNHSHSATAEFVKLGGTFMSETCFYDLIIDRISHEIPYYRSYLKFVALQGCTIINDPLTWSADSKFMSNAITNKLGFTSPRTVVLPNKEVEEENKTDSFRNLIYPMDWAGIIEYVGVPAIFKDVSVGGRRLVHRVHSVDELIQRYDESGTRTMLLQQIIESDVHIHAFVFGQEQVQLLRYSLADGRYLPDYLDTESTKGKLLTQATLTLTKTFGYDINMVEFVLEGETPYVINSTNPAPIIDKSLMNEEQFDWCLQESVALALRRLERPLPTRGFLRDLLNNNFVQ
ncbi:MAG: hypothetical protein R6X32_17330 [Chloroflexota bacterium]